MRYPSAHRKCVNQRAIEKGKAMKRYQVCGALCAALLLVAGAAWAADQPVSPDGTPAILASLGTGNVTVLDDHTAATVRGQGTPQYVLVKVLGLNALDYGGVAWTWNPLGYRYGCWGGPGWSGCGDGSDPVDSMDTLFQSHDGGTITDAGLLVRLLGLGTSPSSWGQIYNSSLGLPDVKVSTFSLFNNRLYFGWRAMPYTEYARREAIAGMAALVAGRFLLGGSF
jgi:hypothetical protein